MVDTAIREAVGVFDRSHLSLLAGQNSIEAKLGHRFEKVSELEDDPEVPTQAYIGTDSRTEGKGVLVGVLFYVGACAAAGAVVASGGTAAAALVAGAGAGGACKSSWIAAASCCGCARPRLRTSGGPSRPCVPTALPTCMCTTCRSPTMRRPAASPAT